MHVEHVHEDTEPLPRRFAHAEFRWRNSRDHRQELAIGRADEQPLALRRYAFGIPEESHAPKRNNRECPTGWLPEPIQHDVQYKEQRDERPALAVRSVVLCTKFVSLHKFDAGRLRYRQVRRVAQAAA